MVQAHVGKQVSGCRKLPGRRKDATQRTIQRTKSPVDQGKPANFESFAARQIVVGVVGAADNWNIDRSAMDQPADDTAIGTDCREEIDFAGYTDSVDIGSVYCLDTGSSELDSATHFASIVDTDSDQSEKFARLTGSQTIDSSMERAILDSVFDFAPAAFDSVVAISCWLYVSTALHCRW